MTLAQRTRCQLCTGPLIPIRNPGNPVACAHCDVPCHRGGTCHPCKLAHRATP